MILNAFVNSLIQLILFSIVPFIYWLIFARKKDNFLHWTGLKLPVVENKRYLIIVSCICFMLLSAPGIILLKSLQGNSSVATFQFLGTGFKGIIPAVLYSVIQTGLSEEILFRGFIGKRVGGKWGFKAGNITQACLFGLVHGLMLIPSAGIILAVILFIFTFLVALLLGYINEKLAGGSIIPSWTLHSVSNLFVSILMMFSLL